MDESKQNGRVSGGGQSAADTTWTEIVQAEPIACLAIAAAAGFLLGGGMRRKGGMTVLTMLGQIVVREVLGDSGPGQIVEEATREVA